MRAVKEKTPVEVRSYDRGDENKTLDSSEGRDDRRRQIRDILADLTKEIRRLSGDTDDAERLCTALAYLIESHCRQVAPERARMIVLILGRIATRFDDLAGRRDCVNSHKRTSVSPPVESPAGRLVS